MSAERTWAWETFGAAELGDARRTSRLVMIAASVAQSPSGVLLRAFPTNAEREAAYRFVESDHVSVDAIGVALFGATAARCAEHGRVVVALDQSTVSITDLAAKKAGLGRTGGRKDAGRRGFEVMSGLAVTPKGEVLGLVGQAWYARPDTKSPPRKQDERPCEERESGLWARCAAGACEALKKHAPNTRPWFQLDRGADVNHVLEALHGMDVDFTVRSAHARRLTSSIALHDEVKRSKPLGRVRTVIVDSHAPAGKPRGRAVELALRARRVKLRMSNVHGTPYGELELTAVHVREVSRSRGEKLDWLLLTSVDVHTVADAHNVVDSYRRRWVVEEFHRAWKSGVCDVERSQLRSADAFKRWATILAAVATRAERLKTIARTNPDMRALEELSRDELDAVFALTEAILKKKAPAPGTEISIGEAVEMIAFLGHYTGRKNSGGPPGATVIGRGLERVAIGVALLQAMRQRSG